MSRETLKIKREKVIEEARGSGNKGLKGRLALGGTSRLGNTQKGLDEDI